jgi:hypothetical protein
MKVKDLIKELQKLDPEGVVYKSYSVYYSDSDGYESSEDEEREISTIDSFETTIERRLGSRGGIKKTKCLKVIIS